MDQNKRIDDGYAIWITGSQNEMKSDIHINQWLLPKGITYLDFGVRIYDADKLEYVYIFVPYELEASEIIDLQSKFKNEEVCRAIFNDSCKITVFSDKKYINIDYNNREEHIISLPKAKLELLESGTIICYDFTIIKQQFVRNEIYLRFRIPHKSINRILKSKEYQKIDLLTSPIMNYCYNYILKVNEIRSLPEEVRSNPMLQCQNIKRIMVIVSVHQSYEIDEYKVYKKRQLEKIYASYVPKNFTCDDIISYEWFLEGKRRYNFDFKLRYKKYSLGSLVFYIFLIIVFSTLGSALWEGIKCLFG